MIERFGVALFRAAMLLLPGWLRERAGDEMVAVFVQRHRRASTMRQTVTAWSTEFSGVVVTGVRARLGPYRQPGRGRGPSARNGGMGMNQLAQDLRFALRTWRRRPGITFVAVTTLGLGIASSTAMFSVVDAVLLTELPYPEPDRVMRVYPGNPAMAGHPTLGGAAIRGTFAFPEHEDLVSVADGVFESFALASGWGGGILTSDDEGPPMRIPLGSATPELLGGVLRIEPLVGRLPSRQDADLERNVLVLTEGFWERRFARDPGVVGTTVSVDRTPYEIIGVMPSTADLPDRDFEVEAWTIMGRDMNRGNHSYNGFGRLAAGVTPELASARLSDAYRLGIQDHHDHTINVLPARAEQTRRVRGALTLLTVASLLLLFVACGNVTVLLLGVALDRERELAVRTALGAERKRIFAQLLTESTLLGGAGALIGVALAAIATRGLVFLAPAGVPRIESAAVDLRALAFCVVAAVGCGLLSGLLPSVTFSRHDLRRSIGGTRGSTDSRARLQGLVVAAEVALATVMLVGGGLMVRTVLALRAVDPGFETADVLTVNFSLPTGVLLEGVVGDEARSELLQTTYAGIAEQTAALPGVESAAYTSVLPLGPGRGNNYVYPDGANPADVADSDQLLAERRFITPNYFETLGIEIVAGRGFTADDDRTGATGTMIISKGLADAAWPGESPLGREMSYWGRSTTVVGVADNVNDEDVRNGTDLAFYVPLNQADQTSGTLVLRTSVEPTSLAGAVRSRIEEAVPGAVVISARPMSDLLAEQIAGERYRARLAVVFAALAALFSLMGIYAVSSRSVTARSREIGIRMALGAERSTILGSVVRQAGRLALVGAAIGIAVSTAAGRLIEGFLWGVDAVDPVWMLLVAATLGLAAVAAAFAPGRRATRVDPLSALRAE